MGSPPCLKKAMLTVTVILNKNGLTVQCCVCVHRPMCCAALKNDNPSPPNPYISEMAFSCRFQKVYTYPPPGDDMFARGSKSCRNYRKVPKPTKLAGSECPREIWLVETGNPLPPKKIISNIFAWFFLLAYFRNTPCFHCGIMALPDTNNPISLMMTLRPERRMKWLVKILMRLQQILRTQAAYMQNQMKAEQNMSLEIPLFYVFPLASGVAIFPCLLIFHTSKM